MVGSWTINVSTSGMPEKIATAFSALNEMVGAEYDFIAYLGTQLVNGTNHAVLAKQSVIAGKDTVNIVTVIFHETKEGVTLMNIERVLESGEELGGVTIAPSLDFPENAKEAYDICFDGYVGANVEPFAYLGSQVVHGENHFFAAEVTPVTREGEKRVAIVAVNGMTKEIAFSDLLSGRQESMLLGYAFTWLKRGTSIGAPLGEWP